jgi:hypothetical protein
MLLSLSANATQPRRVTPAKRNLSLGPRFGARSRRTPIRATKKLHNKTSADIAQAKL